MNAGYRFSFWMSKLESATNLKFSLNTKFSQGWIRKLQLSLYKWYTNLSLVTRYWKLFKPQTMNASVHKVHLNAFIVDAFNTNAQLNSTTRTNWRSLLTFARIYSCWGTETPNSICNLKTIPIRMCSLLFVELKDEAIQMILWWLNAQL